MMAYPERADVTGKVCQSLGVRWVWAARAASALSCCSSHFLGLQKVSALGIGDLSCLFCTDSSWKEEFQTALKKLKKQHFGASQQEFFLRLFHDINRSCPQRPLLALIPKLILEGTLGCGSQCNRSGEQFFLSECESYLEICFVIRERSSFVQKYCFSQIAGTRESFCARVIYLLHFVLFHLLFWKKLIKWLIIVIRIMQAGAFSSLQLGKFVIFSGVSLI